MPAIFDQRVIDRATSLGHLDIVRCNTGKTAVVWQFEDREVWLGESSLVGRRRAIYDVISTNKRAISLLRRLEGEAKRTIDERNARAVADLYATAMELGIDLGDGPDDSYEPTPEDVRIARVAALG